MKILAIRIKNLASLEGITEIDFTAEPLCSAGIFAITGPTGAGKSTILDALCLALYARTPRYLQARETGIEIQDVPGSTIGQGDIKSILRDGSSEGFAAVDFRGIDRQRYRATWAVRRARNKASGALQADTVQLENLDSGQTISARKTEALQEIERRIGLSFDQFTRSVLLAQGDFTAFLKANKDEKSSLLEKLTGTQIYSSISKRVFENFKTVENELRELEQQKAGIEVLTEEDHQILDGEKLSIQSSQGSNKQLREELTKEIRWNQELVNLQSAYESAEEAYMQAMEVKDENSNRRANLETIQRVQTTRARVEARQNAEKKLREATANLADLKNSLDLIQQQKTDCADAATDAEAILQSAIEAESLAADDLNEARKLDEKLMLQAGLLDDAAQDVHNARLVLDKCQLGITEKKRASRGTKRAHAATAKLEGGKLSQAADSRKRRPYSIQTCYCRDTAQRAARAGRKYRSG